MYKRIDFSNLEGLAVYQDTLDFLQTSYREAIAALSTTIGDLVIVNGVIDQGAEYSSGWVVINGELLPLVGGLKASRIVIEEISDTEIFGDDTTKTVYYTRRARLGNTGGYAIADFVRLQTLRALRLALEAEITTRQNSDVTFQNNISSLQSQVSNEVTSRTNGENFLKNRPICVCHARIENISGVYFQQGPVVISTSNRSGGGMRVTHNMNTLSYTVSVIGHGHPVQVDDLRENYFDIRYYSGTSAPGVQNYHIQIFRYQG